MPGVQELEPPSAVPVPVVFTFTLTVLPVEPPRTMVTATPALLSLTLYVALENRTLGSLSLMASVATLGLPRMAPPVGVPSVTARFFRPSTSVSFRIGIDREALVWFGPN